MEENDVRLLATVIADKFQGAGKQSRLIGERGYARQRFQSRVASGEPLRFL